MPCFAKHGFAAGRDQEKQPGVRTEKGRGVTTKLTRLKLCSSHHRGTARGLGGPWQCEHRLYITALIISSSFFQRGSKIVKASGLWHRCTFENEKMIWYLPSLQSAVN